MAPTDVHSSRNLTPPITPYRFSAWTKHATPSCTPWRGPRCIGVLVNTSSQGQTPTEDAQVDTDDRFRLLAEVLPLEPEHIRKIIDALSLPPRALLRTEEAARVLGVSRTTIYRLIDAGEIERVHVIESARITRASIDAYIARLRAICQEGVA